MEVESMLDIEVEFDRRMTINVDTPAGPREYAMDEVLGIDPHDLSEELTNQAGTYAWWGAILENAKYELDQAELQLERAEIKADQEVRDELVNAGTKVTEALVKRMIPDNSRYVLAASAVHRKKRDVGILIRVVNALSQRKDMLRSLAMAKDADYVGSAELRATSRSADSRPSDPEIAELKRRVNEQTNNQ